MKGRDLGSGIRICAWNMRARGSQCRSWAEGGVVGPGLSICSWNVSVGAFRSRRRAERGSVAGWRVGVWARG